MLAMTTFATPDRSLRARLVEVARSLELFAAPAYLTDPYNRIVSVNRRFAELAGDPNADRLPGDQRYVPAAMLGPYRDRFPHAEEEVAACLPGLRDDLSAGRLAPAAVALLRSTLRAHPKVARRVRDREPCWDGSVVFRGPDGAMVQLREQVVAVADARGAPSGYSISQWVPLESPARRTSVVEQALTARQLELAKLFARGLTSRRVADRAGITHRTARDHAEAIYARLDVHSRAELAALLAHEGLL